MLTKGSPHEHGKLMSTRGLSPCEQNNIELLYNPLKLEMPIGFLQYKIGNKFHSESIIDIKVCKF